jgi:hypothetical protein
MTLLLRYLCGDKRERLTLHRHYLIQAVVGLACRIIRPREINLIRMPWKRWPSSHMDLYHLRVLIMPQQLLQILLTIQNPQLPIRRVHDHLEGIRLTIPTQSPLNMRGFDLASVVDLLPLIADKSLSDVDAPCIPLAVAQRHIYVCLFAGGFNAVHFWRVATHGTGHVLCVQGSIRGGNGHPYRPERLSVDHF